MADSDRLRELEEKYEDYKVYDNQGSRIGKVDDLFIDDTDREEYIGVKMGFFGMRSTLIPMEIVRVNERDRTVEVSETKDRVKEAPNFDDDDDITTEYEERIRSHFGLETSGSSRGDYGTSSTGSATTGAATGETRERETRGDDETRTNEPSAAGSGGAEHRDHEMQSEATGDRGAEAGASRDAETAGDASQPGHGGSFETRGDSPAGESGSEERRDDETAHGSGSEGTSLGESGGGTPVSRQTEETETYEEGGRTKIRRRIVREEVEEADEGPGSSR